MSHRNETLAQLIVAAVGGEGSQIVTTRSCSGGCIHRAQIVELSDGTHFFVKSSPGAADMFAQEAFGLAAIAASNSLRTPRLITAGMLDEQEACLVLEAIEPSQPCREFWQSFGSQLADMHRRATAQSFGWSSDNYLGSSIQPNAAHQEWTEFFAECRLGYQVRLARNYSVGSRELFKLVDRLISRLDDSLGTCDDPPSLLHGDLWSGNFMVGQDGAPVVFDPAVYYGQREADLAMPLLFGGFAADFWEAYQEAWPLSDGWQQRVEIYKLYHLLNHLNLFGSGYLDCCLEIARKFA